MPNTYTQIHMHAVFAVRSRSGLIQHEWKNDLYKYITGILQHYNHKLLAINGMPDHVHIFFGMRPNQSLSDLMQDIKGGSSKWINDQKLVKGRFEWQQACLPVGRDTKLFLTANHKRPVSLRTSKTRKCIIRKRRSWRSIRSI